MGSAWSTRDLVLADQIASREIRVVAPRRMSHNPMQTSKISVFALLLLVPSRAFAAALAARTAYPLRAVEIDRVLHAERLDGRAQRRHRLAIDELPDGALLELAEEPGTAFAVRGPRLLRWTPAGYAERRRRPHGFAAQVLTPPAILSALSAGYRPRWHPSAENQGGGRSS